MKIYLLYVFNVNFMVYFFVVRFLKMVVMFVNVVMSVVLWLIFGMFEKLSVGI